MFNLLRLNILMCINIHATNKEIILYNNPILKSLETIKKNQTVPSDFCDIVNQKEPSQVTPW